MGDAKISAADFVDQDILKTIQTLVINKVHDHDHILTHMIKICDSSIVKPLSIIFCNSLNYGIFPDNWERSNIVPVNKKGNTKLIENYLSVSVLPVTSKIFVRLILNSLYKIAKENSCSVPINPGSGTDSSVNQLWSICTKFTNLLITIRLWKRGSNFRICQKLLIGFGMKV